MNFVKFIYIVEPRIVYCVIKSETSQSTGQEFLICVTSFSLLGSYYICYGFTYFSLFLCSLSLLFPRIEYLWLDIEYLFDLVSNIECVPCLLLLCPHLLEYARQHAQLGVPLLPKETRNRNPIRQLVPKSQYRIVYDHSPP